MASILEIEPPTPSSTATLLLSCLRSRLLCALTLVNLLLIILHVLIASLPNEEATAWLGFFRIDRDRGLSEWFETAELAAALAFLGRQLRHGWRSVPMLVAAVLSLMLIDNVVELRAIAAHLIAPDEQAIMEVLIVSALLPIAVVSAAMAYRGADMAERSQLVALSPVLALFGFFAVVTDFLHETAVALGPIIYASLSVVEDGGELLTLSYLLVVVQKTSSLCIDGPGEGGSRLEAHGGKARSPRIST